MKLSLWGVMMSDDDIMALYDKMLAYFGKLPNPEYEPIQFQYLIRIFNYYEEHSKKT